MDGGSIQNLHVTGTINTSALNAAGIIAQQYGSVTIRNCRSSVTINSSVNGDGTHGGLVAGINSGATLSIEGCIFDGSLLGTSTNSCGGFVGWRGGTVNISNSLFAPTNVTIDETSGSYPSCTFSRNGVSSNTNNYYTQPFGTAIQGNLAIVVNSQPANLGELVYDYGWVKAYSNGIEYNNKYYLAHIAD